MLPPPETTSSRPQGDARAAGRSPPSADDYAIMEAVAAGDTAALAALYDRHSPLLFALALRILRDRMSAEDLLIDVYWEIWNRSDRYDPARGSPLTYLLTLARSLAIDRRRSTLKHQSIQLDPAGDRESVPLGADTRPSAATPLADAMTRELADKVRSALARLDPAQRQAVELSYFDDLSHSQIAERLGRPLGTVKTNIRQGLIRLRESMRMEQ